MGSNLIAAHSQWAHRPADERFWTLADMQAACEAQRSGCKGATVAMQDVRILDRNGVLRIGGPAGETARFTNYSFGQFCTTIGAPASYLRSLPTRVAAECMAVGVERAEDRSDRKLLLHQNGELTLRAALSEAYDRVWDADVCRALSRLVDAGWRVPAGRAPMGYDGPTRAATAADILPGQINITEGATIAPSGLYASDRDMFAFLVAPDRVVEDGNGGTLMRGVFVRNSEVGAASLSFTFFLMQAVCGNHIVWNATGVHEVRARHVGEGTFRKTMRQFELSLLKYRDAADVESGKIAAARSKVLGATKEEVLDELVKYCKAHSLPLPRTTLANALDVAEDHESWYGNPRTVWAAVAGLTHASQAGGMTDNRTEIDRAAGKLMEMAF